MDIHLDLPALLVAGGDALGLVADIDDVAARRGLVRGSWIFEPLVTFHTVDPQASPRELDRALGWIDESSPALRVLLVDDHRYMSMMTGFGMQPLRAHELLDGYLDRLSTFAEDQERRTEVWTRDSIWRFARRPWSRPGAASAPGYAAGSTTSDAQS